MRISESSSLDLAALHILVLHLMDELEEAGNEGLLAELSVQLFTSLPIIRALPEQKRVAEFLRAVQRLELGVSLSSEERNLILEQCRFVQPLIGELSATTHFYEGRQDDED